jgi:hypothetical protein
VFENKMLRKIFGPKRDDGTGEWRRLRNEELYNLYSSPIYFSGDQIKKNEMGGARSKYGGEERCIVGFGGEALGKQTTWKT